VVNGWLTSDHAAYVAAEVVEAGGAHELLIDTGFGGFLYIPEDHDFHVGLVVRVERSDRARRLKHHDPDGYEATIVWFGAPQRVSILSGPSGCDSLLGMELLEGCRIELDRVNAEVRLEKL
jgi:predicted aspartyl protease